MITTDGAYISLARGQIVKQSITENSIWLMTKEEFINYLSEHSEEKIKRNETTNTKYNR